MREKAPGHRQLAARHRDRALMEIDAERQLHRVVEHAKRFHVIGQRGVAKTGALLGGRDRFVDRDCGIVGDKPHEVQDFAERLARPVAGQDQVGDRDGARIDERVARNAALEFKLDDRVECAARGLAADPAPEPVAGLAERERQGEDLGDALDRERHLGIATRGDVSRVVDHRKPERIRVGVGELRNIGRDLAAIRPRRHLVGDVFDDLIEVVHCSPLTVSRAEP